MLAFSLLVIFIVIVCLAILLRPLVKVKANQTNENLERNVQNINFAKTRLAELNDQLAVNAISQEDYDNLKLEIEATLAEDLDLNQADDQPHRDSEESNGVVITLLCTVIPFSALMLYQVTGTPAALNPDNLSTQNVASEGAVAQDQDIQEMVKTVELRLQENPNDPQGWAILSRTYMVMERYQDAYNANLKLLALNGENATIYTQLADSSALMAGGKIAGVASEYIQKALAIDPNYPQALWLAGLGAAQAGNSTQAREYWETLMPLLNNSPQQQQELREIIAETMGDPAPGPVVSEPEPEGESLTQTQTKDTEVAGISISISIAEMVLSETNPNDTIFVFARAQNGPPAPLAVKRLTVADLPTQIQLSDGDAMLEQFKLSLFEDITVLARVSKSGNPISQNGDIQSNSVNTKNDTQDTIELVISEFVVK
ncbi:MAG: c-type cytochrome biogenesis protein CcmI [Acidiferrobacterales bacterium]|nr:c-type cytochrome biogenesis protein CcmI [Acidiferrobacterales bacterium]